MRLQVSNGVMRTKMTPIKTISEGEVLLGTLRFLLGRKAIPFQVSVPTGQGIDTNQIKNEVKNIFANVKFDPEFVGSGPDVIAISEDEYWIVECKGTGKGQPSTQRNNFDRALASTVSYYEDNPANTPDWAKDSSIFIGLALPNSKQYLHELKRRVRMPLRKRLNLWVLLYDAASKQIMEISPDADYS